MISKELREFLESGVSYPDECGIIISNKRVDFLGKSWEELIQEIINLNKDIKQLLTLIERVEKVKKDCELMLTFKTIKEKEKLIGKTVLNILEGKE